MSMFKKPEKLQLPKEVKVKEEHPYLQDIKKSEIQKAKSIQDKLNEAKMTLEQKKLKAQLERSKKSYVRV